MVDLLTALRLRHSDAVFVAECKDGATQTRAHLRLDAWVLLKTWSPITTIGYEIKTARSDWLRDQKIQQYQGLCHLLYVVAPKGCVKREELPGGVGLVEPVGDGTRLVIRHKASRAEIDIPVPLLIYVLMSRASIDVPERGRTCEDPHWRARALREWVAGKDERRGLSYAVSQKIRAAFDAQELRLEALERRARALENIKARIVELGFDPDTPSAEWQTAERLRRLAAVVPSGLCVDLKRTADSMLRVKDELEQLRGNPDDLWAVKEWPR